MRKVIKRIIIYSRCRVISGGGGGILDDNISFIGEKKKKKPVDSSSRDGSFTFRSVKKISKNSACPPNKTLRKTPTTGIRNHIGTCGRFFPHISISLIQRRAPRASPSQLFRDASQKGNSEMRFLEHNRPSGGLSRNPTGRLMVHGPCSKISGPNRRDLFAGRLLGSLSLGLVRTESYRSKMLDSVQNSWSKGSAALTTACESSSARIPNDIKGIGRHNGNGRAIRDPCTVREKKKVRLSRGPKGSGKDPAVSHWFET